MPPPPPSFLITPSSHSLWPQTTAQQTQLKLQTSAALPRVLFVELLIHFQLLTPTSRPYAQLSA